MAKNTDTQERRQVVSEYYTELDSTHDLKTNVCVARPLPAAYNDLYSKVPQDVKDRFYGCGSPFPPLLAGCRILDLGCGAGRDTFIMSGLVGPKGEAIGLDMTDAMLDVAKQNVKTWQDAFTDFKPNVRFVKGVIEELKDIEDNSIDVCISNCVVNLSADKPAVLKSVHRVLKTNGEFYFSDIYADRRLTTDATKNKMLIGECVGGAEYYRDFISLSQKLGFKDPRIVESTRITVSEEIDKLLKGAQIYSITMRLFKNDNLEEKRENYGDVAVYNGADGLPEKLKFDENLTFEKGKETKIDSNAAAIMTDTERFKPYICVKAAQPREHLGAFDSDELSNTLKQSAVSGGCCGGKSTCCS